MSTTRTTDWGSAAVPRTPQDGPHVHTWELRAVEFDTWGKVSLYECLGCSRVRYE